MFYSYQVTVEFERMFYTLPLPRLDKNRPFSFDFSQLRSS